MRYCVTCQRLLTIEEQMHLLEGQCFDCFYPPPSSGRLRGTKETADYWRSDDSMLDEDHTQPAREASAP